MTNTTTIQAETIPALRWQSAGEGHSKLCMRDGGNTTKVASVMRLRTGNQRRVGIYVRGSLRAVVTWQGVDGYGKAWKQAQDLARSLVLVESTGVSRAA